MNEFSQDMMSALAYELPDEILNDKMCGNFSEAALAIDRWLERPVGEALKTRMRLEKQILIRLKQNYPYTAGQAVEAFRQKDPLFARADLERLDQAGLAEWIFLDGEKHYIHNLVRNVLRMDEKMRRRAGIGDEEDGEKRLLQRTIQSMRREGKAVWRFRVRASIRLQDELFYPGISLKVHLPVPARLFQIHEVKILDYSPKTASIDREDSLYRAICFCDTPEENREYSVEYEYTVHAVYHDLSGADCRQSGENPAEPDEELTRCTQEQYPHIRFSPYLRALAREIVGEETRPLEIARKIYDYITINVNYSYMREYFLIPDLPQYCARNLRGDCGVQALLFITLCRICRIPAKWQSGLYTIPGSVGPHDWAMFWVRPYGWLFADPSFGGSAFRDGDEERRRFYFGNLDPFRMAANNAFQQPFAEPKRFLPADPCDNQSGEMESDEHGFGIRETRSEKVLLSAERLR